MPPATPTTARTPFQPPKPSRWQRMKNWIKTHKKETVIFSIIIALFAAVAVWAYIKNHGAFLTPEQLARKEKTTKPAPLTGVEVPIALADRPVTGLMIENSPDARPQSGVIDAGVVFEAVAEGGITRFLVLYQEARPGMIGPVRSLRPYYLDWAQGYDAPVGHVGGSAAALQDVRSRGAKDLDQFNYGTRGFDRVGFRAAPHNVYTNFDKLDALNKELGYTTSNFTPYQRKGDTPHMPPNHTNLTFDFSGPTYTSNWVYDATANHYLRNIAGAPDIDKDSGKQLFAKNIVYIPMPTTYDGKYAVMTTAGSGDAQLFLDGSAFPVKWSKKGPGDMIELKTPEGNNVHLNIGNTWFEIVPAGRTASF